MPDDGEVTRGRQDPDGELQAPGVPLRRLEPEDVVVTCSGGITIPPIGAGDGSPPHPE
jgi:hypothetical protein